VLRLADVTVKKLSGSGEERVGMTEKNTLGNTRTPTRMQWKVDEQEADNSPEAW